MIRKAEITDVESICQIGKQSFLEAHEHSSPKEDLQYYLNQKFTTEELTKEISDLNNLFYLSFYENELAGYSKIIFNSAAPQLPDLSNDCKLERIYFLKNFYGKKLGLKLFEFNKELCIQNNQSGIWLTVWVENERAITFYEKLGFKTIGEVMFKVGNVYNPNLVMRLEL